MEKSQIYSALLMMNQIGSETTNWLIKEGYLEGDYQPYNTKKAGEYIISFEKELIDEILDYLKAHGSISWQKMKDLLDIDHIAFLIFNDRLLSTHKVLIEKPDHVYVLNPQYNK